MGDSPQAVEGLGLAFRSLRASLLWLPWSWPRNPIPGSVPTLLAADPPQPSPGSVLKLPAAGTPSPHKHNFRAPPSCRCVLQEPSFGFTLGSSQVREPDEGSRGSWGAEPEMGQAVLAVHQTTGTECKDMVSVLLRETGAQRQAGVRSPTPHSSWVPVPSCQPLWLLCLLKTGPKMGF